MTNRNKNDIYQQMFDQVDAIATEVEANRELIQGLKEKLAGMPSEERLGGLRAELVQFIERVEREAKNRSAEAHQRAEEKRHAERVDIDRLIEKTVNDEHENADKEFPRRLRANLAAVLDEMADERREKLKRRLLQLTPWIALAIMSVTFIAQCSGVAPNGLSNLGEGIARIR